MESRYVRPSPTDLADSELDGELLIDDPDEDTEPWAPAEPRRRHEKNEAEVRY